MTYLQDQLLKASKVKLSRFFVVVPKIILMSEFLNSISWQRIVLLYHVIIDKIVNLLDIHTSLLLFDIVKSMLVPLSHFRRVEIGVLVEYGLI